MAKRLLICYIREFIAMEIRHLRYFVAVAEALSFTKAAIILRLAQPSLTRQINGLEEELGVLLLNRTKHDVSLVDEGRSFLIDAKHLLNGAQDDRVRATIKARRTSALNVGYLTNLSYDLLPPTLASFRKFSLPSRSSFSTCNAVFASRICPASDPGQDIEYKAQPKKGKPRSPGQRPSQIVTYAMPLMRRNVVVIKMIVIILEAAF